MQLPTQPGHENNSRHRTAEAPPEVLRRKVSRGHVLDTNRRVSAGVLNNLRRSALLRAEHGRAKRRANAFARGRRAPLADLSRRMTHSTPSYNIAARTYSGMLLVPMTGVRRSGLLGGAEPATTLF
jgi:hypothetical protein